MYVIDSIVRQSRHQFGADKDVFAQRFAKNIHTTFQQLLQGAPNEKVSIIHKFGMQFVNVYFGVD